MFVDWHMTLNILTTKLKENLRTSGDKIKGRYKQ